MSRCRLDGLSAALWIAGLKENPVTIWKDIIDQTSYPARYHWKTRNDSFLDRIRAAICARGINQKRRCRKFLRNLRRGKVVLPCNSLPKLPVQSPPQLVFQTRVPSA